MRRIDTADHVAEGLTALLSADPRLADVIAIASDVPLRRSAPGFESLVSIVVSQQVSRASAQAMMGRLRGAGPIMPAPILAGGADLLRLAGISRPKQRAILGIAQAVDGGTIDLDVLCLVEAQEAMDELTALPGVGPWTAEIYLLFAAGHPDIFPAKDVALQNAVARAFAIDPRPDEAQLAILASAWKPWRGIAARLFWAYHHATTGRNAAPLESDETASGGNSRIV